MATREHTRRGYPDAIAALAYHRSQQSTGSLSLLSHVFLGVRNFERALEFYEILMQTLGYERRFLEVERPWAGWQRPGHDRPLFLIGAPYDGHHHEPGNGQMIALLAGSRSDVDRAYDVALASGGTSEGKPGLRPEYHQNYYGAYFRDTEGNKLCVVTHEPEQ